MSRLCGPPPFPTPLAGSSSKHLWGGGAPGRVAGSSGTFLAQARQAVRQQAGSEEVRKGARASGLNGGGQGEGVGGYRRDGGGIRWGGVGGAGGELCGHDSRLSALLLVHIIDIKVS